MTSPRTRCSRRLTAYGGPLFAVNVLFFALTSFVIFADDLPQRLDREFARLASDDAAERDAAVEAIAKEGRAAEPAVKAKLANATDPEARGRLERALQLIDIRELAARRWNRVWEATPVEEAPCRIALSRDGRLVATAGEDGVVDVHDTTTGKLLWSDDHVKVGWGFGIGFSPDGRKLLVCAEWPTDSVRAWDSRTGKELKPLARSVATSIELFSDGEGLSFVDATMDLGRRRSGAAWIVDASGWVTVTEPQDARQSISSDGARVVLCEATEPGEDGKGRIQMRVFSTSDGSWFATAKLQGDSNFQLPAISPDGRAAAIVVKGRVQHVRLESGAEPNEFGDGVVSVAWTGADLVSIHTDGKLRWWRDQKVVRELHVADGASDEMKVGGGVIAVTTSRQSKDGKSSTSIVQVFAADSGTTLKGIECGWVGASPRMLVVSTSSESFAFQDGKPLDKRLLELNQLESSCIESGRIAYVAGASAFVKSTDAGAEPFKLSAHHAPLESASWIAQGVVVRAGHRRLAVCAPADGKVVFCAEDGLVAGDRCVEFHSRAPDYCRDVIASADGRWIAERTPRGAFVYPVDGSAQPKTFLQELDDRVSETRQPMAISRDGSLIALARKEDGAIQIYKIQSTSSPIDIPSPGNLHGIYFAPEGNTLLAWAWSREAGSRLTAYDERGTKVTECAWPQGDSGGLDLVLAANFAGLTFGSEERGYVTRLLDLRNLTAPPADIEIPSSAGVPSPEVVISSDGESIIGQCQERGSVYASRRGGLKRVFPTVSDLRPFAAFLPGGHPIAIGIDGLRTLYGPTGEDAAFDASINGHGLALSPDGKRLAILSGARLTVYELR